MRIDTTADCDAALRSRVPFFLEHLCAHAESLLQASKYSHLRLQVRGQNRSGGVNAMLESLREHGWITIQAVVCMPIDGGVDFNANIIGSDIRKLDAHHRLEVRDTLHNVGAKYYGIQFTSTKLLCCRPFENGCG
jgi:hypothetical protein